MLFNHALKKNTLSYMEKEILSDSLKIIRSILTESENIGQQETIDYLLKLLYVDDGKFIHELNSAAMWGGSGAVWEVFIQDKNLYRKFVGEMIKLMEYMKYIKITRNKRMLTTIKKTLIQDILKI